MFSVGDKAVYPAHGVGVIESIEKQEINGTCQSFYMLKVLDSGIKIMIPTCNIQKVGLRRLVGKKEIPKIYKILSQKDVEIDTQTWNRRYRDYTEKIKTGSVFEISEVLRDLYLLKTQKDLSFGERKLLDTAKNLLIKELSLAQGFPEQQVEEEIDNIFR